MSSSVPLCPAWQAAILETLRARGAIKVAALQADVRRIAGVEVDDTTVLRWISGKRGASFGLLAVLLEHCDPALVLSVIGREYGLTVTSRDSERQVGDVQGETLGFVGAVGLLAGRVQTALADRRIDAEERQELLNLVDQAAAELADVRASLTNPSPRSTR
jgi:hypothetical protein